ncbi:TniB family NTP-binding protein [Aquitalea sp.]|uniref:TniB family NTP-binding protein n=1 Tax=Aquitalea sp. TaxID=1872623 RepID=UPI0025825AEB|nr:TniB family NTP-binding protein [Aquitalea sp.]
MMQDEFSALTQFSQEYLSFPPFLAAFEEIERSIQLYRAGAITQHLLVTGESGTGKTTLCRLISQKYPRVVLPERDVQPVLYISIPPAATIVSVSEAMLAKLGDPNPTLGTSSTKTARVVRLAQACSVELLLLDEANHIQDRGQSPTQYLVGDWIKGLMDGLQIPAVLLGLPRVESLLRVNEQLRRRFTRRMRMELGQSPEKSIEQECLELFYTLIHSMPIPFSIGSESWDALAHRLYFATDGRVAYLKKLLTGAIRLSFELDLSEIRCQELAQAFEAEIWPQGIGPLNPFSHDFAFRRLDRQGEPFEQGAIASRPGTRRAYAKQI